jgi:hypothetical protein
MVDFSLPIVKVATVFSVSESKAGINPYGTRTADETFILYTKYEKIDGTDDGS